MRDSSVSDVYSGLLEDLEISTANIYSRRPLPSINDLDLLEQRVISNTIPPSSLEPEKLCQLVSSFFLWYTDQLDRVRLLLPQAVVTIFQDPSFHKDPSLCLYHSRSRTRVALPSDASKWKWEPL